MSMQVSVRVVTSAAEQEAFDQLLGAMHYLGEAKPVGDFLRQEVVDSSGHQVGLLVWGPCCYRLKDRDEHIGWNRTMRTERLKLIVQNRRFLLPHLKGHHPNEASQILAAAVRALPEQWEQRFGYRPLLAETFTDLEAFAGTCYKATNWQPVGLTKGYQRHRAEFFRQHDRPKKLWIKELEKGAVDLIKRPQLPEAYRLGAQTNAHGVMPLKNNQIEGLHDLFCKLSDPRRHNTTFSLASVLCIVVMALMSGKVMISEIHRFGTRLSQQQRKRLALPKSKKGKRWRVPGYKVYYNLLRAIDIDKLADCVCSYLRAENGDLPSSLAMDGKFIGNVVGLLGLCDHETGVPEALAMASQKEGEGEQCELKVGQKVLASRTWDGKIITGDPLHCQKETASLIVENGGEFMLQLKGNQPGCLETAEKLTVNLSPFLPGRRRAMGALKPVP